MPLCCRSVPNNSFPPLPPLRLCHCRRRSLPPSSLPPPFHCPTVDGAAAAALSPPQSLFNCPVTNPGLLCNFRSLSSPSLLPPLFVSAAIDLALPPSIQLGLSNTPTIAPLLLLPLFVAAAAVAVATVPPSPPLPSAAAIAVALGPVNQPCPLRRRRPLLPRSLPPPPHHCRHLCPCATTQLPIMAALTPPPPTSRRCLRCHCWLPLLPLLTPPSHCCCHCLAAATTVAA